MYLFFPTFLGPQTATDVAPDPADVLLGVEFVKDGDDVVGELEPVVNIIATTALTGPEQEAILTGET